MPSHDLQTLLLLYNCSRSGIGISHRKPGLTIPYIHSGFYGSINPAVLVSAETALFISEIGHVPLRLSAGGFHHTGMSMDVMIFDIEAGYRYMTPFGLYAELNLVTRAAGYACLETKTPMTIYQLHHTGSHPKLYTAVAIFLLEEDGSIEPDNPISTYLPEAIGRKIPNASRITVRQLLNHTSGL